MESTEAIEYAEAIKKLREYVSTLEEGQIDYEHKTTLIDLLIKTWHLFSGSSDTKMHIDKLERIYNVTYKSPDVITFEIERHGATAGGSIYAHVHQWALNLTEMDAFCDRYFKKITVGKREAPLKTQPLSKKVADAILNLDKGNKYLDWKSDDKVKVLVGDIIPATKIQTTTSRRKRFRNELDELLQPYGWSRPNISYIYVKEAVND